MQYQHRIAQIISYFVLQSILFLKFISSIQTGILMKFPKSMDCALSPVRLMPCSSIPRFALHLAHGLRLVLGRLMPCSSIPHFALHLAHGLRPSSRPPQTLQLDSALRAPSRSRAAPYVIKKEYPHSCKHDVNTLFYDARLEPSLQIYSNIPVRTGRLRSGVR